MLYMRSDAKLLIKMFKETFIYNMFFKHNGLACSKTQFDG